MGPRADAGRLDGDRGARRVCRLRRWRPRAPTAWRRASTTRSCRSRRPPTGGRRSAGGCATSPGGSGDRPPGCGCPRRRWTLRRWRSSPRKASSTRSWPRGSSPADLDPHRPYRVDLPGGRSIAVALYDASLSTSVSFEPSATVDADRFARERSASACRRVGPRRCTAVRPDRHGRGAVRAPPAAARPVPGATGRRDGPRATTWSRSRRCCTRMERRCRRRRRRPDLVELSPRRRAMVGGVRLRPRRRLEARPAGRLRPAGRGDRQRDRTRHARRSPARPMRGRRAMPTWTS